MLEIKNLSSVVGGCLCKCQFEGVVGTFQYNGGPMPQYGLKWVELGPRKDYGTCQKDCSRQYSELKSIWCR